MKLTTKTITVGLGACLVLAGMGVSPAAPAKVAKTNPAQIAQGKALASSLQPPCTGCHGADLAGKKGFSPSLHTSGVLREYNPITWARVMDTGVTNDGGHVKRPMPVYHLKAAQSNALYAYFKTLK